MNQEEFKQEIESTNTYCSDDFIEIRVNRIILRQTTSFDVNLKSRSKRKSFVPKKIVAAHTILNKNNFLLRNRKKHSYSPIISWNDSASKDVSSETVMEEPHALVVFKPLNKITKQGKYLKNMTPQRRVEANTRERQRVHTITNAFDRLQSAIPSPNHSKQSKLSKLSVIKIATAYIMVLSRIIGYDYSIDGSTPSVDDCILNCKRLMESESRLKTKQLVL
uniref:BHLH domain-containing protein n=2 Tax=Lepeophtheirus salmonis TaxID=72036 RepID=A0A0K2TYH3_LEPSM